MLRPPQDGRGEAGFTMIEVMVALVITMLALGVFYQAIGGAMSTAQTTAALQNAVSRARSRLASIDDPMRETGERSGDDGDGYRWRTQVDLIRSAPPPQTARAGEWSRGTSLYSVSVKVSWRDGRSSHDYVLDGAVLGPTPGAKP